MYKLVKVVADNMIAYYPYVQEKVALIEKLVKQEEESFHKTLANGEALLQDALAEHADTKILPGEVMFKLYDTYGYPKELTTEIAEEEGYRVDSEGLIKKCSAENTCKRSTWKYSIHAWPIS